MKLPRLIVFIVSTVAAGFFPVMCTPAQVNAGKPVLSAPPPPAPQNDPPAGQVSSRPAGQVSGQPGGQGTAPAELAAAAPGLPAPGSADVPPTYVIGPDDSIVVSVWKEPSLSGALPVRPDGMISLALVGDLQAAGFTPMQLAQDITSKLRKFVNDPNVTVTVTGVNSKRIFLMGEVGHTGPLPLSSGLTPLSAIASAGGISPFANGKHIYILRTVSGKQMKIPFDYRKAIKTGDQQGVTLQSGDTIVVP